MSTEEGNAPAADNSFKTLMDAIPEESRHGSFHDKFNDFASMYNSYASAEKLIGKDKVPVPDRLASEDEYMNAHRKLSNIKESKDYDFEMPKGLDDNRASDIKELMFKNALSKVQASKLINGLTELETKYATVNDTSRKDQLIDWESKTMDMFNGRQEEASLNVKRALAKLGAGYSDSVDYKNPQSQKALDILGGLLGNANVETEVAPGNSAVKQLSEEQDDILAKFSSGGLSADKMEELDARYSRNQARLKSLAKK